MNGFGCDSYCFRSGIVYNFTGVYGTSIYDYDWENGDRCSSIHGGRWVYNNL